MKIALVTTDFLPNIGGVTQHVVELAKAFVELGDDLEVVAPLYSSAWSDFSRAPFHEEVAGIPVYRIPFVLNRSVRFVTGQITSRVSDRKFQSELLDRLRRAGPDIVHWHALESRSHPLARWHGSAKVWTNHTSEFIVGIRSSRQSYYRTQAEQADEIITPSDELRDLTVRLGIASERVHFIPNGVDVQRFNPRVDTSSWRKRLDLKAGERVVLCPRRLEKKNGVRFFIQAAIELLSGLNQDVKFVVAGDFKGQRSQSDEGFVTTLVARSGFVEHFALLGRVENADMPGLYAASDIVVIPSLIEATSLSVMEAMAAARAVIATEVGGLPFLVRHGENGLLVSPAEPAELAQAMRRVLDSPGERAQFGNLGRERVEKELDWNIIARRTRDVYISAIQRHDSRTHSSGALRH